MVFPDTLTEPTENAFFVILLPFLVWRRARARCRGLSLALHLQQRQVERIPG